MTRDMNQWFSEILLSEDRKIFPLMNFPGLQLTGMNVKSLINNTEYQLACQTALAARYETSAWVTMMDLSVEAEAFGSKLHISENEAPTVVGCIIQNVEQARSLVIPPVRGGRTDIYLKAAALVATSITDRPVFGCHIGPLSLAGRLFDTRSMMLMMIRQPEVVHDVLEKCTEFLIEYCRCFKESGVNGVIIAEPMAGLLSPAYCTAFSSQYIRRIVFTLQDKYFAVILHNCGNTLKLVTSMLDTGARGFHFGNSVKMNDILSQVPDTTVVMGNIEPAGVFKLGTVEQVRSKTQELLEETKDYRNFIISSGCDIPPGTPMENIDAFFDVVKKFNVKRYNKSYKYASNN